MKIRDIKKMKINKDEVLLIKVPDKISDKEIYEIKDFFQKRCINGAFMYKNCISFTKIKKGELDG